MHKTVKDFHVLCKANEIFMVGVDVGDLDVDQQQHLLSQRKSLQ